VRIGNFRSIQAFSENVYHLIEADDVSKSLQLVHYFVERIITEPLCTSQVFGSKVLDDLCQHVGRIVFSQLKENATEEIIQHKKNTIVYVVTKLQKSGGHTRVIENFIAVQPNESHVILSTELLGKSDFTYLNNLMLEKENLFFEPAVKNSYKDRLLWLQRKILEINPKKIYLFNHHQDSVAVAAIQPEMKLDASFYHHGDHHLCLGVYLSHLEHIDFHPMGYHTCRDELGIDNIYIPLTVQDKMARPVDLPFLVNDELITCTAAKSNKIEIPYFVSYLDIIPKLLKTTGGKHIHIGRLTPWALFKIRRGLKKYGVQPDKFIYTPWVPSVWKALHEYKVDLYIASFPYGGGLTLIEAMGAGVPVILHRHIFSRVLSSIDLAYSEAFNWRSPDELLNYCATVTQDDLQEGGRLGRVQYEKFHTESILHDVLNGENRGDFQPNASSEFSVASDERAIWMEQQLTIRRVLTRGIYRLLRRLRARWG